MTDPSSSGQSPEPEGQPRSREQRLEALGQLAAAHLRQQETISSEPSAKHGRSLDSSHQEARASRPVWLRAPFWLAIMVVLAGIGVGLWRLQVHSASQSAKPPARVVTIVPRQGDMDCPHDLVWSPSGSTLAVLGYDLDCVAAGVNSPAGVASNPRNNNPLNLQGPLNYVPGLINLYNTHTGGLIRQIHPDALILPHINPTEVAGVENLVNLLAGTSFGINYTHILWSADGQRLAVSFSLYVITGLAANSPPGYEVEGLLLTDLSGQQTQVFLHPLTSLQPAALVWDLSTGHLVRPQAATQATPTPFTSLSPALGYQWGPDGSLDPQTPLAATPSPAPPLGPVGSPHGGSSFSLWQSGFLSPIINTYTIGQPVLQNAPNYSTVISAWSPGGRYVVENVEISGLLTSPQTPAPPSTTLAPYGWAEAPQLPVRDAALQQAISVANTNSFISLYSNGASGILVSWRPDGQVLAVDAANSDDAVTLYDCATGKVLTTLKPDLNLGEAPIEQNETNVLSWSPDGRELALYDTTGGLISIWSGSYMPKS